ncbi:preprotein translocase subunit SecG [Silanimonas sp.]|uniref:preprotein translocase subunit SecG n=1 Tax=Silanimonas sp. TaxID=1929290 RepID=UPI001BBE2553|nr:preprotein translocase subunit SecG [Silanimonas sp.]MBS3895738.1 preprotein translocase subunit SecG [Silanimonas sp.]MBS3924752.1 preprotein translocase subunit SecG [Xanthomonadaceae bacterium]
MNWIVIATVIYVIIAIAMIVLILMQRGAGAQAGTGFGGGASATVFGASGSANFLSKSTKWLAIVFFAMSLGMAWYASQHGGRLLPAQSDSVGIMAEATEAIPAVPESPPAPSPVPAAPPTAPAPAEVPADSPGGDSGG